MNSLFRNFTIVLAAAVALGCTACSQSSDAQQTSKGGPMELRFSKVAGEPYDDVSGQKAKEPESLRETLSSAAVKTAREKVYDKLGEKQVSAAEELADDPLSAEDAKAAVSDFAPWGELSPKQVAVLPASLQFHVPAIGCQQLNARNVKPKNAGEEQFAACQKDGDKHVKFLVKEAALTNKDVAEAEARPAEGTDGWMIGVTFSDSGTQAWQELAQSAANKRVAIMVDGEVITAPEVQPGAASSNRVDISGDFGQEKAERIASHIVT